MAPKHAAFLIGEPRSLFSSPDRSDGSEMKLNGQKCTIKTPYATKVDETITPLIMPSADDKENNPPPFSRFSLL